MLSSPVGAVRFPEPGETLLVRPADSAAAWYKVHHRDNLVSPCVPWQCPFCPAGGYPSFARWEGYLCCRETGPAARSLVLRLPRGARVPLVNLVGLHEDLAAYQLTVHRSRHPGRPSLALTFLRSFDVPTAPQPTRTDTTHFLRRWWDIPRGRPDYRRQVWALAPLLEPRQGAAIFDDWDTLELGESIP